MAATEADAMAKVFRSSKAIWLSLLVANVSSIISSRWIGNLRLHSQTVMTARARQILICVCGVVLKDILRLPRGRTFFCFQIPSRR